MRGLSGAHFIVGDASGRVLHTSLPRLEQLAGLAAAACRTRGTSSRSSESPAVLLEGTPYFAMSVRTQNGQPGDVAVRSLPANELAAGAVGSGDAVAPARVLRRSG